MSKQNLFMSGRAQDTMDTPILAIGTNAQVESSNTLIIECILESDSSKGRIQPHASSIPISWAWLTTHTSRISRNSLPTVEVCSIVHKDSTLKQTLLVRSLERIKPLLRLPSINWVSCQQKSWPLSMDVSSSPQIGWCLLIACVGRGKNNCTPLYTLCRAVVSCNCMCLL